jgi:hypothetical protein
MHSQPANALEAQRRRFFLLVLGTFFVLLAWGLISYYATRTVRVTSHYSTMQP